MSSGNYYKKIKRIKKDNICFLKWEKGKYEQPTVHATEI